MDELEDEDYFVDDYDEDPYNVNQTPEDREAKTQETLTIQPSYEKQDGIKFEFTGTLLVPTASEYARLTREKPKEMMTVVGSKPVIFAPEPVTGFAKTRNDFKKVKMNGLDALRLRQRGV